MSAPRFDPTTVKGWVDSLADATSELLETLGLERVDVRRYSERSPEGMGGAYIPLVSEEHSVQLAVISDPAGCYALARLLLMMEPDEELSEPDMADAMGEWINIVGGGVKTRMIEAAPGLALGLPVFIHGYVLPTQHMEMTIAEASVAGIETCFLAMRPQKGA